MEFRVSNTIINLKLKKEICYKNNIRMASQTATVYSSTDTNLFVNNKTFYAVQFKDTTYAFVMKDTLTTIIKNEKNTIESIVKFNYEHDLDIHTELLLFSDDMKVFGSEYMKAYENLPEMYGSSPIDEFDKKIIFELNGTNICE